MSLFDPPVSYFLAAGLIGWFLATVAFLWNPKSGVGE